MVAVLLLLPGTGSDVADDTVAVFEMSSECFTGGAVIVRVIGAAGPTGSDGMVQVTTPAANPQVQPVPVALTKPEPAGRGSVTDTDAAAAFAATSGRLLSHKPVSARRQRRTHRHSVHDPSSPARR